MTKPKADRTPYVDPAPLLEWLDSWLKANGTTEHEALGGLLSRSVRRYRTGESTRANIHAIDTILVAVGKPELLTLLYPDV